MLCFDNSTLRDFGYPFSQEKMSYLLKKIPKEKVLFLDILFGNSHDSSLLAKELIKFKSIHLPIIRSDDWIPEKQKFYEKSVLKSFEVSEPLESSVATIFNISSSFGITDFDLDEDSLLRFYPLVIKNGKNFLPSLSFLAYLVKYNLDYKVIYEEDKILGINLFKDNKYYSHINLNSDPLFKGRIRLIPNATNENCVGFNQFKEQDLSNLIFIGYTASGVSSPQGVVGYPLRSSIFNHITALNQIERSLQFKQVISFKFMKVISFILLLFLSIIAVRQKKFTATTIFFIIIFFILLHIYLLFELIEINFFPLYFSLIIALVLNLLILFLTQDLKKKRLQKAFSSYLDPHLVQEFETDDIEKVLKGQHVNISIMFIDLRGFTSLSEKINTRKLIEILNCYFEIATECILRNNGTVDKFIGDAVMAFWNSPVPIEDHCSKSVKAAIEIILGFRQFASGKDIEVPLKLGIGLNCGEVVVGNIGSKARFNFTAIGDAVNLTSRIESLTKYYNLELIITDKIFKNISNELKNKFLFLEEVLVVGKENTEKLYFLHEFSDYEKQKWLEIINLVSNHRLLDAIEIINTDFYNHIFAKQIVNHLQVFLRNGLTSYVWQFKEK